MPYGTVTKTTRELIDNWLSTSGVERYKLYLDGEDEHKQEREPGEPFSDSQQPVVVSVITDGALDEEFVMGELFAVNIADLIADQCEGLMGGDLNLGYEVIVAEEVYEDTGAVVYVRRSNPITCKNCGEPLSKHGDEYRHVFGEAMQLCDPANPDSKIAEPVEG